MAARTNDQESAAPTQLRCRARDYIAILVDFCHLRIWTGTGQFIVSEEWL